MAKRKNKKGKKSNDPKDIYDAWLDFSKEINDEITKRIKEGAKEYENMYKVWNEYAQNMSEKLAKFSLEDEDGLKEIQELWNIYSDELGDKFTDLFSQGGSPYRELYQVCASYSDRMGECLLDVMNKRMEEQRELYELWMDAFALTDKDFTREGTSITESLGKSWLQMLDKSKDMFSPIPGTDTDFNIKLKELNELWTRNYSKLAHDILKSDAFARMNGAILDRNLDIRRLNEQSMNQYFGFLGLPTKESINEIYKKLHEIDRKLSQLSRTIKYDKKLGGK